MILDTSSKLSDQIVELLSLNPNKSAESIRKSLRNPEGNFYTLQAVYQELRNLRKGGVVIKNGNTYSLWGPWVIKFIDFADKLSSTYLDSVTFKSVVPEDLATKTWRFENLVRLSRFWGQVLSILIKQTKSEYLLSYFPHQWHYILRGEYGRHIQKSMMIANVSTYTIIGSDTPLDRWAEQYWRKSGEYSFSKSPFHKLRKEHISVVGNYVVTLKLSKNLTEKLEKIYKQVITPQFVDFGDLYEMFSQKARSTLSIELNARKAKQIKRKFSDHFGVGFN